MTTKKKPATSLVKYSDNRPRTDPLPILPPSEITTAVSSIAQRLDALAVILDLRGADSPEARKVASEIAHPAVAQLCQSTANVDRVYVMPEEKSGEEGPVLRQATRTLSTAEQAIGAAAGSTMQALAAITLQRHSGNIAEVIRRTTKGLRNAIEISAPPDATPADVQPTKSELFTLGPGTTINANGNSAPLTAQGFGVMSALQATGSVEASAIMRRAAAAVWNQKYQADSKPTIQKALSRLNSAMSEKGVRLEVSLHKNDEIVVRPW